MATLQQIEANRLNAQKSTGPHPATPEVRALVDTLVTAEWLQRRYRTLEAQLFKFGIHGLSREVEGLQVVQAYDRECQNFDRLQRRINAGERIFHRALVALQKIESRAPQPTPPVPDPEPAPDPELA